MKNITKLPVLLLSSAALGFISVAHAGNTIQSTDANAKAKSFLTAEATVVKRVTTKTKVNTVKSQRESHTKKDQMSDRKSMKEDKKDVKKVKWF